MGDGAFWRYCNVQGALSSPKDAPGILKWFLGEVIHISPKRMLRMTATKSALTMNYPMFLKSTRMERGHLGFECQPPYI